MYHNYVNSICEFMYKKHEGTNVNTHNEFGNDTMKMCLKYKKKLKVLYKIKDWNCVFITWIMIFDGAFFVMSFLCLDMHIFSPPWLWFALT